jgi:hypothetical protein
MAYERTLAEVFGAHADVLKNAIRKCLPGTVTAVNPAAQTVDVQIAVNNLLIDDNGAVYSEPAPGIAGIPLGVMRGGGFFVWVPVSVGDSVLVLFTDLSTDTWRAGNGQPVDPGFVGKHTMDSAFAIPCCAPDGMALVSPAAGKLIIGKDGSSAQIKISATDIELGASVTDSVALASLVNSAISTIVTAFNSHFHLAPSGGAGGPTSTVALTIPPGTITPSPPSVASTLVKTQ